MITAAVSAYLRFGLFSEGAGLLVGWIHFGPAVRGAVPVNIAWCGSRQGGDGETFTRSHRCRVSFSSVQSKYKGNQSAFLQTRCNFSFYICTYILTSNQHSSLTKYCTKFLKPLELYLSFIKRLFTYSEYHSMKS